MLRKNTGSQSLTFGLINATNGAALTGASVTAYRCIDNGAQASVGGTVTEKGNGQYCFAPSQADTNGDLIGYLFTATSAIPVNLHVRTTAADLSDGVRLGLTALPNAAAGASGGLPTGDASGRVLLQPVTHTGATIPTVTAVTNRVTANTDQLAGQTVTAATGVTFPTSVASPTNITAGTITTVTNLTNAPTAGDFTATMKASIGTAVAASAVASVTGDVGGKVLGGGAGTITGTGVRAVDSSGNAIAPASTALSTATWTNTKAGYLDAAVTSRQATFTAATSITFPTNFGAMLISSGGYPAVNVKYVDGNVVVGMLNVNAIAIGDQQVQMPLTVDVVAVNGTPTGGAVPADVMLIDGVGVDEGGVIPANVVQINGAALTGAGTSESPWGPA